MTIPHFKTFVIVNPASAGGATMRRWPSTYEKIKKAIGGFEYDFTNAAGVATLLAEEAIKGGYNKIVAVGGDGTLHEVIQGLFEGDRPTPSEVVVGMIPSGTGSDFMKSLRLPANVDEAVVRLRGEKVKKIDLGLATFVDHRGRGARRYFINFADVGLGGEVAQRTSQSTKVLGGFATYLFSSMISFASYRPKRVTVKIDGEEREEIVTSLFVANGEFAGGGMRLAPQAECDDGFFDVVLIRELSKWALVSFTPRLYSGTFHAHPAVKRFRAQEISVTSGETVLLSLDGEQPGTTPVTLRILPKALNFKV